MNAAADGAGSYWGGAGRGAHDGSNAEGESAAGYGSGGGGGTTGNNISRAGGTGAAGIVVIYEYKG